MALLLEGNFFLSPLSIGMSGSGAGRKHFAATRTLQREKCLLLKICNNPFQSEKTSAWYLNVDDESYESSSESKAECPLGVHGRM